MLPRALHQTDRPSATAQLTLLCRALELQRPADERIVTDRFAPVFLPRGADRVLAGLRGAGGVVRAVERLAPASIATSVLCRHRFIDAHLLEELPEVEQVLVLGAGWDSRAYRFAGAIGRRAVFEVDLPPLSRAKRAAVDDHPDVFRRGRAVSVEIDFRTQTLPDRLAATSFAVGARTVIVWEGVSMYLTPEAVRGTLAALAELCGPGSVLVMDCWQHVGRGLRSAPRRLAERSLGWIGEPLGFAVAADRVGALLGEAGFEVIDLAAADTLTSRYATGGRRCDPSLFCVAARLG